MRSWNHEHLHYLQRRVPDMGERDGVDRRRRLPLPHRCRVQPGSLQRLTSNALEQSRTAMAAAKNLDWTGNAATLCARTLDRDTRLAASIDDRVRQTGQLAWSGGSS